MVDALPTAEIALVTTPFASIYTPSIQLGLLKAICKDARLAVDDFYLNVEFVQRIGARAYNAICFVPSPQIGEWLFSHAAFGNGVRRPNYLEDLWSDVQPVLYAMGLSREQLNYLRSENVLDFVAAAARKLSAYRVVAFSSTFQQNAASLAIAKALKSYSPNTITVFGGSNMHGPMGEECFRAFDWIDVVVTGEADHLIVPLFRALLAGEAEMRLPGVLSRVSTIQASSPQRYPVFYGSMDDLPIPDYGSYFAAMQKEGLLDQNLGYPISIPFESSRGCWWGAKHHCTFCGLNSVGMTFRTKSAGRVRDEISTLMSEHHARRFDATDNIITRKGGAELLESLSTLPEQLDIFYEIKANVDEQDVKRLARAGVRRVQPGIESLSTDVLRLMNKGTTALQNINALRWLFTYGIRIAWNILYGFPGEKASYYDDQRRLIPLVRHLPPPIGVSKIRLDRFSPNFEQDECRSKFADVRPLKSYAYIYPELVDLERLAYHFEGTARGAISTQEMRPFFSELSSWKNAWGRAYEWIPFSEIPDKRPTLEITHDENQLGIILENRSVGPRADRIRLNPVGTALMHAFFAKPTRVSGVMDTLNRSRGFTTTELDREFDRLCGLDLIAREAELALALPVNVGVRQSLSRQGERALEFAYGG